MGRWCSGEIGQIKVDVLFAIGAAPPDYETCEELFGSACSGLFLVCKLQHDARTVHVRENTSKPLTLSEVIPSK